MAIQAIDVPRATLAQYLRPEDTSAAPCYRDLEGKTVFITGGGSGIGARFTRAFSEQKMKVGFVSLRAEKANPLCDEVEKQCGVRPFYRQCDIRDIKALQEAIEEVKETLGPIDVLVNNAARDTRHALHELKVEQWDDMLNTNLRPYFFTTQAVVEDMKQRREGSIINLGSNCAKLGLSGYPAYVAAKSGIIGLTKAFARELGEHNIRVNALIPGWVMTQRQLDQWVTEDSLSECLSDQCLKQSLNESDIAMSALFLASSVSSMVSGQEWVVDGGRAL